MTVKEQLLLLPKLESTLRSKRIRLEALKDLSVSVSGQQITGMPRNPSPSVSRMADTVGRIVDLEREITEDEQTLENVKVRLLEYIGELDEQKQAVVIGRDFRHEPWNSLSATQYYSVRWLQEQHREAMRLLGEKDFA